MGPKRCKTKHMANLDGTLSDPGWDLDVPGIGPRRGSEWHPETVTDIYAFLKRLGGALRGNTIRGNRPEREICL